MIRSGAIATWLIALFAAAAPFFAAQAAPPQRANLAEHLDAMSAMAQPFLTLPLAVTVREQQDGEDKVAVQHWQRGLFRQEQAWLGLPEVYGYDGAEFWYGSVERLPFRIDLDEPADVAQQFAAFLWYLDESQRANLYELSEYDLSEAAGVPHLADWELLGYRPPLMSEAWLLVDPATHLLAGCLVGDDRTMDKSQVLSLCLLETWKDWDGTAFPAGARQLTLLSDGKVMRERKIITESVQVVPELDAGAFSMAAAPAVPTLELPANGLSVPFELQEDKITLTLDTASGHTLRLKLDTGASVDFLRRERALELGFNPAGSELVFGHGKSPKLQFFNLHGLRLGPVELPGHLCAVMPAEGPEPEKPGHAYYKQRIETAKPSLDKSFGERGIDGLLGNALLNFCIVRLDYGRKLLTLYDPQTFQPDSVLGGSATQLPLRRHELPYAPVTVDGRIQGGAFFNSGAQPYFSLSIWAVDQAGLDYEIESLATGLSLGGTQIFAVVRPELVELGPLQIKRPFTYLEMLAPGDEPEPSRLASFGTEFLHDYIVTFDLPHERVFLEPLQ